MSGDAAILCLNAGSSTLKLALFAIEGGELRPMGRGLLDAKGPEPRLRVTSATGDSVLERAWPDGGSEAQAAMLMDEAVNLVLEAFPGVELAAASHRIVHGAERFVAPVRVDEGVLAALEALCALAPLHQPHNLAGLRRLMALRPNLVHVACFDTAFHKSMPELGRRFAIPERLHAAGVRRYGFHGLSYEHVASELERLDPDLARGRVVAAHLGSGASLCALLGGESVETTMGFSALDGLVMGTRCGALDPGVLLHLLRQGEDVDSLEQLLYRQSGLLGISGVSADMRSLARSAEPAARLAIDMFCRRAAQAVSAHAVALGGLDGLVFTAGIGEHDASVRAQICAELAFLGVAIDPEANAYSRAVISTLASRVRVRIIPADEERRLALHALELIKGKGLEASPSGAGDP